MTRDEDLIAEALNQLKLRLPPELHASMVEPARQALVRMQAALANRGSDAEHGDFVMRFLGYR